jgi:flavin-dependent dehydrogenase
VSGRHAAIWAAEAVEKVDFSPEFLKNYDKAVYNRLGQELRLSRVMQRLLNFPSLFNIVANRAVSNPTLAATLSMMFMDLDLREQLRKPSFYFKLFFGGK